MVRMGAKNNRFPRYLLSIPRRPVLLAFEESVFNWVSVWGCGGPHGDHAKRRKQFELLIGVLEPDQAEDDA